MHLAFDVVSEHLTVEPKENLLFDLPAAAEEELGPALLLPLSEEEEEGEALAAAAIDDFRALLTLETRAGGILPEDEEAAPAVECLFV